MYGTHMCVTNYICCYIIDVISNIYEVFIVIVHIIRIIIHHILVVIDTHDYFDSLPIAMK